MKNKVVQVSLGFSGFMFSMGLLFYCLTPLRPIAQALAPWLLLGLGLLFLVPLVARANRPFMLWLGLAYLATFGIEVLGVKTGMVFGPYLYDEGLGPRLWGVPPIIGFNWIVVILAFWGLALSLKLPRAVAVLFTGLGATVFDGLLEPAAVALGLWHWLGPGIPVQNYVAWFIIAALAALALDRCLLKPGREVQAKLQHLSLYVGLQGLFFVGVRIVLAFGLLG